MNLIDYILDLFRSPAEAAMFIADPDQSMRDAGLPNVTAAQLQAVAATAAPAGVLLGGGDPVVGLQRAVADHHSIASPFSPSTTFAPSPTFAPETNTQAFSNNDTNAEFLSPDQTAGANSQAGAFNFGIGDITLGDKTTTTQTAVDGGVIVNGDNEGEVQTVNDVRTGDHSPVVVGDDNELDDESTTSTQVAGGDIIQDNEGPVISDVDMSGGSGGDADGSDSLLGIGIGNDSTGGSGGNGGSIVIVENDNDTTTQTYSPVIVDPAPQPLVADNAVILEPAPQQAVAPQAIVAPQTQLVAEPQFDTAVVPKPEPVVLAPVELPELPDATTTASTTSEFDGM